LRDYYRDMSGGLFDFTGQVSSWLTMPRAYGDYVGSRNGRQVEETNARTLLRDAVEAADPEMNYCDFDRDSDGLVDAVVLVHAGPGAEESPPTSALWSHQSRLPAPFQTDDVCNGSPVSVSYYLLQPEIHWRDTLVAPEAPDKLISIGVFAHELGHVLGLPDLYDRDYDTNGGVGTWELMAQGAWGFNGKPWRPAPMSAWTRAELGWVTPEKVLIDAEDVVLPAVDRVADGSSSGVFNLYPEGDPDSPEYLMLEFRSESWVWSTGFPKGIAIWHVNEANRPHGNDDQDARLLEMVQADGLDELGAAIGEASSWGDAGDLFPGTNERLFLDAEGQPATPFGGAGSTLAVRDIEIRNASAVADLIIFDRKDPPAPPSDLEIEPKDDRFSLEWKSSPTPGVTEQLVYRVLISGAEQQMASLKPGASSFVLPKTETPDGSSYVVKASNGKISDPSNSVELPRPRTFLTPGEVVSRSSSAPDGRAAALGERGGGVVRMTPARLAGGGVGVSYDLAFSLAETERVDEAFELFAATRMSGTLSVYDPATGTYVFVDDFVAPRKQRIIVELPDLSPYVTEGQLILGITHSSSSYFEHLLDRVSLSYQ
jgi:M6 family metalloprotease-like protein